MTDFPEFRDKINESQEDFIARRSGARLSLEDIADEIYEKVDRFSYLRLKAFDFICAKELLMEALEELGFEFE